MYKRQAIPAHPQKQYTRRWRLYHFCGFYYPIREVIPIAIYHWNVGIVSRGKGKSAVAAAAYRSGEKLTNEWDGMTHDYTPVSYTHLDVYKRQVIDRCVRLVYQDFLSDPVPEKMPILEDLYNPVSYTHLYLQKS